jgi:hypothetical protein
MTNDTRLDSIDRSIIETVRAIAKPEDQFVELIGALIARNPKLQGDDSRGSEDQQAVRTIAELDMQLQNGGLMQFFWNCPQLVEHVSPSLRRVGIAELADHFDKAVEQLAGSIDSFVEHREGNGLEDFIAAAEENDFEWFDDIYLGDFDRKSDRWSGLVEQMYQCSVSFILANLDAFVRPSGGDTAIRTPRAR